MTPSERTALIDRLTTMARWQRDNMNKVGVYNNFTNGSLVEEAATALRTTVAATPVAEALKKAMDILHRRADGYESRASVIFNGRIMADELRGNAREIAALCSETRPIPRAPLSDTSLPERS